jgi:hypothetical protein
VLRLLDKDGELKALLGIASDGTPIMRLMGGDNEPLWSAP